MAGIGGAAIFCGALERNEPRLPELSQQQTPVASSHAPSLAEKQAPVLPLTHESAEAYVKYERHMAEQQNLSQDEWYARVQELQRAYRRKLEDIATHQRVEE